MHRISIAGLNLVGFLPEEIKWLSSLEYLDMQNNHLVGPIPESLGELVELRYLSLDGNNFSGTIPDVFHNLLYLGTSTTHLMSMKN
jgi:Leucine-rich repeat (LRR) protein